MSLKFYILSFGTCDIWVKVKGKVVPMLNKLSTMPWRHIGQWRCSSTILNLSTKWRWLEAKWASEPIGMLWKRKNVSCHWWKLNLVSLIVQSIDYLPVAIPTELSQILWFAPTPPIFGTWHNSEFSHFWTVKVSLCIVLNVGWASTYPEPEDKRAIVEAAMYNHNYDCPLPAVYPWPELPTLKNVKIQKTSKASSREI
jgi:hypothetical protein